MASKDFYLFKKKNHEERDISERITDYQEFVVDLDYENRLKQASRCMNCGVPFCGFGNKIEGKVIGCPLHNLIPEWNYLLSKGLLEEAYNRLSLTSPFPEFTSRVCPGLCEKGCTCNIDYESVSIKDNEKYIIEWAYKNNLVKPINPKRNGKKVLVVGSGPAGLAAANSLNKLGYLVTIIEKHDRFGGLLMYGIPNMKLDKGIIERRISIMEQSGIIFKCNQTDFEETDYDAIIMAIGTTMPGDLEVKGRFSKGIMQAVDYLTLSTKSLLEGKCSDLAKDKNVVIIGGGDTGNDCVATAIREHAKSITQIEIMDKPPAKRTNSWPLYPNNLKIDYGTKEYIELTGHDPRIFNASVTEFIGKESVESVVVSHGKMTKDGFVKNGEEKILNADLVILAMGFVGTKDEVALKYNLDLERHNIKTNNYQTSREKFFACGDSRSGQSLVVSAIKDGIDCSLAVDEYLKK